jgi:hypothetical protein
LWANLHPSHGALLPNPGISNIRAYEGDDRN